MLRAPNAGDAPSIHERFASDPEVARYLANPPHASIEETRRFVAHCMTAWVRARDWTWILSLRGDPSAVGYVQIQRDASRMELGFALARPLWGRGYMPEAVRQVMAMAFEDPTLYRVGALCQVNHWASIRVLEKAGMAREGLLRKLLPRPDREPADVYSYARVRGVAPRAYAPSVVQEEVLLGHSAL